MLGLGSADISGGAKPDDFGASGCLLAIHGLLVTAGAGLTVTAGVSVNCGAVAAGTNGVAATV